MSLLLRFLSFIFSYNGFRPKILPEAGQPYEESRPGPNGSGEGGARNRRKGRER
jgi:hypothetical protein